MFLELSSKNPESSKTSSYGGGATRLLGSKLGPVRERSGAAIKANPS